MGGDRHRPPDQADLERKQKQLTAESNSLKSQQASLERQQADLLDQKRQLQQVKQQQQQAEKEKKQTEQLKQELTDMLTKAGGDDRGTDPRLVKLQDALATPTNVQLVSPPSINKGGDAATFTVIPKTRPADPRTAELVTQVRTAVVPPATGEGGITAYVGGVTAANVDLASKISSKLAELILVVLALSIVLLLIAFRSLLIPVQAAVTVGLSVAVLLASAMVLSLAPAMLTLFGRAVWWEPEPPTPGRAVAPQPHTAQPGGRRRA